jgi:hypothetical protein
VTWPGTAILLPQRPKPNDTSLTRCHVQGKTSHGSLTGDGGTVEAIHGAERLAVARPHQREIAIDMAEVSPVRARHPTSHSQTTLRHAPKRRNASEDANSWCSPRLPDFGPHSQIRAQSTVIVGRRGNR